MRTQILRSPILLIAAVFFMAGQGKAQEAKKDIPDDKELERYIEVDFALRDIRRERQKKTMEAIENSSLSVRRFREVTTAQKGSGSKMDVSKEEQKEFENVQAEIEDIRTKYAKKEERKIREMDMKVERYREISRMKTNKKVRQRMVRMQEKKMEEVQKESSNDR